MRSGLCTTILRMPDFTFSRLAAGDLEEVIAALRAAELPTDDISEARTTFFRLADSKDSLGWAALERSGADALLRSVLTVENRRHSGLGSELVRRIARTAAEEGIERLWLLTETAAPFFAKLGFVEARRDHAPATIRDTSEFRSVCPASAICMTMALGR